MDVHVIEVRWTEHQDTLREIRGKVFIEEQEIPKALEWDGLDDDAAHFLALNSAGQHVGCARLLPSGQIGRMAVYASERGNGTGMKLLQAAVEGAIARNYPRAFLHAQAYAEAFYRKGGFLPTGERFDEAGIEHVAMEMVLPLAFSPPPPPAEVANVPAPAVQAGPAAPPREPGRGAQPFDGLAQARDSLLHIIRRARRELYLFSPLLDHELLDNETIIEALSAFARGAPRAQLRIIILDSKLVVDRGHRLLDLARRLDQKIEMRRLGENFDQKTSSFACADQDAYWLLPSHDVYAGVGDDQAPVNTARLRESFSTAWQKSREDPELRILRL